MCITLFAVENTVNCILYRGRGACDIGFAFNICGGGRINHGDVACILSKLCLKHLQMRVIAR
jgi:hypothetical protein